MQSLSLATEAVRRASNGPTLVEAIRQDTGLEVRVLSGGEEAYFAGLGVVAGFYRPTGLVGDMGGGSLEVIEVLDDRVGERSVSLPLGALPVQALMAEHGQEARRHIDTLLAEAMPPALAKPVYHAVGGNWRAFAKAHMAEVGAPLAGEMSGHIFYQDGFYGHDDALYVAVRLLDILARGTVTMTGLKDAMPVAFNTPEIRFDFVLQPA